MIRLFAFLIVALLLIPMGLIFQLFFIARTLVVSPIYEALRALSGLNPGSSALIERSSSFTIEILVDVFQSIMSKDQVERPASSGVYLLKSALCVFFVFGIYYFYFKYANSALLKFVNIYFSLTIAAAMISVLPVYAGLFIAHIIFIPAIAILCWIPLILVRLAFFALSIVSQVFFAGPRPDLNDVTQAFILPVNSVFHVWDLFFDKEKVFSEGYPFSGVNILVISIFMYMILYFEYFGWPLAIQQKLNFLNRYIGII